ncbi:hypothetical protein GCM10023115_42640 [Pontixanthobacter gangjinensis]|uniref:Porin family protein n=1 Tax=Christiangramia aestuarii TaxID=1028746 RepID=A0A7M3SYG3_9FLAO|nr:hypothetical protein [Christiangramia aestuarii]MUP41644.1 hypothetical protein [Christiangramia aestuarii]
MKKALMLFLFFAGFAAQSQTTRNQFSLNFLIPSAEYEWAVSNNSTIDAMAGLGFGYHDAYYLDEPEYGVFPQFEVQYRYYYNFEKRLDKGKKVSENSANYIAAVGVLGIGDPVFGDMELEDDYTGFLGPAWGLQRVYNSNFKLNLNLGAGLGFNDSGDTYFSPLIDIQLGFKLGKE